MSYLARFLKESKNSFFLFGPRGSGKSTWLKNHFHQACTIDLLEPETQLSLRAYPGRLVEIVERSGKQQIVIDEIQKIPQLLEVVHLLIERDNNLQFIMTGSSVRKLREQGVNLLGGRASVRYMHPYMAAELGERFSLQNTLEMGLLPLIVNSKDPYDSLDGYIYMYINPEIQMEGYARKIDDFYRFLEVMSFSHGAVINLSNIAREAHVKRSTAENYIHILEDLLLGFRVSVLAKKTSRELVVHPKFYFFDIGVYRRIRPAGTRQPLEEIMGHALEGLVAQHLRAWCDYSIGKHRLYYWRTRNNLEVDFVVYGDSGIFAFEVKNSSSIRIEDLAAMKAFRKDYPEAHCMILYSGEGEKEIQGVQCVPLEQFLKSLIPLTDKTAMPCQSLI